MTNPNLHKLIHSTLFHLFWGAIVAIEFFHLENKTLLLSLSAIAFVGFHFGFFVKNFIKELCFLVVGFCVGFSMEIILSNAGVYHYGLVSTPGFLWPPPWMAAMWMMFPPLLTYTFNFVDKYQIFGSLFLAVGTFGTYYFAGTKFDLIFFNPPLWQSFVVFSLLWYLSLRFLIRFKLKTLNL